MKTLLRIRVFSLCLIFTVFHSLPLKAQQWTSVQDGNWNNPATWGSSSYPPAILSSGKKVNILHTVSISSSFASTLDVNAGGELNINGGTFLVGTGISMNNRGRFTGINGSLLQCLYVGCGNSGSQASGVWNTIDGGYTRMENMIIQIAQDWTTNNNGKRFHLNCCVKTGQNFSVNHEGNRDTLINTRFEIGLHGSGNFQQNKGKVIYDNIDIDIAGSGGGNVQFSGGYFSGTIRTIRIQSINGNIQASSSMSGTVNLDYYCIQVPVNYQDPANKIRNEVLDCAEVNNLLSQACMPGNPGEPPAEEGGDRRAAISRTGTTEILPGSTLYPNPFARQLNIQFEIDKAEEVTVTLSDANGRQVYRSVREGKKGMNSITAGNLEVAKPGFYFAEIKTASGVTKRWTLIKN